MGSIRAWLPSRRSTAHHSGALVIRFSGQVRSGRDTGSTNSWNGLYRWTGRGEPRCGFHTGWVSGTGRSGVRRREVLDETYASGEMVIGSAPGVGWSWRDRRTPRPATEG